MNANNLDIVVKASFNADGYLDLRKLCAALGMSQSAVLRLGVRRLLHIEANRTAPTLFVNRPKTGRSARRRRADAPMPLRL